MKTESRCNHYEVKRRNRKKEKLEGRGIQA
jgi:hypothetical protein